MNGVSIISLALFVFSIFLPLCIADADAHADVNSNSSECYKSFMRDCCEGHHRIDGECIPICRGGCPRSQICLQPNICGYLPNKSFLKQRPICSNYVADDNIYCGKCNPTFLLTDYYQCKPYCDKKCTNGFCYSPGVCKCHPGYQKDPKTNNCELIIINSFASDDCVNNEGSCQNASRTTLQQISKSDDTPNCQTECKDGICIDGLCQKQTSSIDKNVSVSTSNVTPNCQNDCQNGVCTQDNICQCNRGFILQNDFKCVPQCDRECVNSICVAPTHCECLQGDISRLNISSALKCHSTKCKGVDGKNGCLNGTCVAVNKCQCIDGFLPKPGNRFECVASLVDTDGFQSKLFLYLISIIVIVTLSIIIVLGCFAYYKRRRSACYNIAEIENYTPTFFKIEWTFL